MEVINQILGRIKRNGYFKKINRFAYKPYDLKLALRVVEEIGKSRNPNFVIDDENRFTYENLIRWVQGDEAMMCLDPETKQPIPGRLDKGIYIAGGTGTGKSWALEIMSVYTTIDRIQVNFGTGLDGKDVIGNLQWGCTRADEICEEYTRDGTFERFKKWKVVGIQDLGTEPAESIYMGNRIDVMRAILEYRGDKTDRITLITSNLPINHQKLVDRYGDRVASRLAEMCNYFELRGTDRRKAQNRPNNAKK